jgi:hypothetical protein
MASQSGADALVRARPPGRALSLTAHPSNRPPFGDVGRAILPAAAFEAAPAGQESSYAVLTGRKLACAGRSACATTYER